MKKLKEKILDSMAASNLTPQPTWVVSTLVSKINDGIDLFIESTLGRRSLSGLVSDAYDHIENTKAPGEPVDSRSRQGVIAALKRHGIYPQPDWVVNHITNKIEDLVDGYVCRSVTAKELRAVLLPSKRRPKAKTGTKKASRLPDDTESSEPLYRLEGMPE